MKRSTLVPVLAVFVVGVIVGAVLHREITSPRRPPVRVTLYLSLFSSEFRDSPDMDVYARVVAAELEGRFHQQKTTLYASDFQVTAKAPPCFESRQGCGTAVRWEFELRSKHAIDQQVASIAVGRGELTLRAVVGDDSVKCAHQALVYEGASIAEPFVPQSLSGNSCLRLGPVLRDIVGASALEHTVFSKTVPSTVNVTLTSSDGSWLGDWAARNHRGAELAIVLDGWIIGRVQAHTVADLTHSAAVLHAVGVHQPIELPSIGLHQPMDGAIAMAVNAAAVIEPLFEDPSTSP